MRQTDAHMKIIIVTILLFLLFMQSHSITMVQLFGMQNLLEDMAVAQPVVQYTGDQSTAYTLNPTLYNFLQNFQTRTDFCDYKCPQIYSLPCFILFGCNIQIRNFFLIILTPIIFLTLIGLCCGQGIWTFRCWGKYLGIFTGLFFILWLMKKCLKGEQVNKRRKKERQNIDKKRINQEIQIQPRTEKPFMRQN